MGTVARLSILPAVGSPGFVWVLLLPGLLIAFGPVLHGLYTTIWQTEAQGHGPIVFGIAAWLLWRRWPQITSTVDAQPRPLTGWLLFALAMLLYLFGASQRILSAQTLAAIVCLAALLLLLRGPVQLRAAWFPLFFLLFMVPLPGDLVDALTQPMKIAVSIVASELMHGLGYPVGRSGVVLQVGPYQMLVADACAGLHTLFTLEAMGLLYMNIVRHSSFLRNVSLAVLIIPISFVANVVRVIVLSLVTYHMGDEAGQGFLHSFAGMVLFMSALLLIIGVDSLLRLVVKSRVKHVRSLDSA